MNSSADIIIPVFNGFEALDLCLHSLVKTVPEGVELQIVDDASTDARIKMALEQFSQCKLFNVRIYQHDTNLGFVATVNAAMGRSQRDVILLNSDTITTEGWYQRMLACLRSDIRIATVTPFSNNAEICSIPIFCEKNAVPSKPDIWAQACLQVGPAEYPEIPTGVGYCMLIRRATLDQIGDFDAQTFGRGYGEENDFCMRAAAHGWRNVLCDDAYVVHQGGVSFAQTSEKPGGVNLQRLNARYPHYSNEIAAFINRDPFKNRRKAIEVIVEGAL